MESIFSNYKIFCIPFFLILSFQNPTCVLNLTASTSQFGLATIQVINSHMGRWGNCKGLDLLSCGGSQPIERKEVSQCTERCRDEKQKKQEYWSHSSP